jgi:hypothetical protein
VEIELDPSLNSHQLTDLTLGQSLKLQVSAVNEVGESILSISKTVMFANVPSEPATLQLSAWQTGIRAEWTSSLQVNGDAINGYKVYVDDGLGGPFTQVFDGINYPSTYKYEIT